MARKKEQVKAIFDVGGEDNVRSIKIGTNALITNINEDSAKMQEFVQRVKNYNRRISLKLNTNTQVESPESFTDKSEYLSETLMSSAIQPCIEAYQSNIAFVEWDLTLKNKNTDPEQPDVKEERVRLANLIDRPNYEQDFQKIIADALYDFEATGIMNFEVVRNKKGEVTSYYHVPCSEVFKIEDKDNKLVEFEDTYLDVEGKPVTKKIKRQFKKFIIKRGKQQRFVKEFGDPRMIDSKTGDEIAKIGSTLTDRRFEKSATELIQIFDYYGYRDVPLPRWLSQTSFVKGLRHAEAVNLDFFENNGIPAMIITVSGGTVDEKYVTKIKKIFEGKNGLKSNVRVAVIEAQGDVTSNSSGMAGGVSQPNMQIHSLMKDRNNDMVFEKFLNISKSSIQSIYRLPDILVAKTSDYNRASAETALLMAEDNVFKPERRRYASVFNHFIFQDQEGLKPKFWKLEARPSGFVQSLRKREAYESIKDSGALTPNRAIEMSNSIHSTNMPLIQEEWANYPMPILRIFASRFEGSIDEYLGKLSGLKDLDTNGK